MTRNDSDYAANAVPINRPISARRSSSSSTNRTSKPPRRTLRWLPVSTSNEPLPVVLPLMAGLKFFEYLAPRVSYSEDFEEDPVVKKVPSVVPHVAWLLSLNPFLTCVHLKDCQLTTFLEVRVLVRSLSSLVRPKELELDHVSQSFPQMWCSFLEHCLAVEWIAPPYIDYREEAFKGKLVTFIPVAIKLCPQLSTVYSDGQKTKALLRTLPQLVQEKDKFHVRREV
ncbi:hypothetical protein BGX33_001846 [Mortierella sp. NVP41]|nr:hypothetical protein BGX33_001846 [Mortierella sp. NVP41]